MSTTARDDIIAKPAIYFVAVLISNQEIVFCGSDDVGEIGNDIPLRIPAINNIGFDIGIYAL